MDEYQMTHEIGTNVVGDSFVDLFGAPVNCNTFEQNTSVDEYSFYYDSDIRQLERVKHCGEFYVGRNFKTGGYKTYPSYCDLYRLCDDCLNRRVSLYKEQLLPICNANQLYSATVATDTWTNIRKEFPGEENYICFPQDDGDLIVFINQNLFHNLSATKHSDIFSKVSLSSFINTYDWPEIVNTPEGRRMSGSLGRVEKIIKESYGEISSVQVNLSRNGERVSFSEITQINNEAMDATADLDPHTIVELEAAMHIRDTKFIEIAHERGCDIRTRRQTIKVTLNPNSLSWADYYASIVGIRQQLLQHKFSDRYKFN